MIFLAWGCYNCQLGDALLHGSIHTFFFFRRLCKKLTMREIVEGAGFSPASDYELEENDHGHRTYVDPDEEVVLHNGQHFTVTYTGVTPTSDLG